jgi:hypothetical protein
MKTKKKEEVKVSYDPDWCCKDAEEAGRAGFLVFQQGPLTGAAGFFLYNKIGKARLIKYCPFCGVRAENVEGKPQHMDADLGEE